MRRAAAEPCPACGRARHRFITGDYAVLCKRCWEAVSSDVRSAFNAARAKYKSDRRNNVDVIKAAREALIDAAIATRHQLELL